MNKQELIEKYEKLEGVCKDPGAEIARLIFLEDLRGLDEPQKVQVPQFVADWYEEHKSNLDYELWNYVSDWEDQKPSEFKEWFNKSNKAFQTLVNMHQFGYTVEKEPKYTVKVKATKQYLSNDEIGPHFDPSFRSNFTKSDLEKLGLGWVFDCKGMEVEEV